MVFYHFIVFNQIIFPNNRSPWSSTTCHSTSTSWSRVRWRSSSWPGSSPRPAGKSTSRQDIIKIYIIIISLILYTVLIFYYTYTVYIQGSSKAESAHPFGYLKASTNLLSVNLFVLPYNYPMLLPLLDDLFKVRSVKMPFKQPYLVTPGHTWSRLVTLIYQNYLHPSSGAPAEAVWRLARRFQQLPGMNCIEIGLPGKPILSRRKGLREVLFSWK